MFVSYNLLFSFQIDYSKKKFFRFCLNTKPTQTLPGSQRWEADFLTGCFKSISVRCAISASARRFAGAKTAIRTVRLRRMTGVSGKCWSICRWDTRRERSNQRRRAAGEGKSAFADGAACQADCSLVLIGNTHKMVALRLFSRSLLERLKNDGQEALSDGRSF